MHVCHPSPRRESPLACLLAVVLLLVSSMRDARAETHDTCAGFITQVPAVVTTQGVWCLRHDVSTAITSGAAIQIATNNVTIDCNDYKVGGLAAGTGTLADGISASGRQNITVRNCGVRGFRMGITVTGGAGHLIEHNRLDSNYYVGLNITGENNLLRRNRVFDTGGTTAFAPATSYGIYGTGSVIDNLVEGMATPTGTHVVGIRAIGQGDVIRGNSVKYLVPGSAGTATGIMGVAGVLVDDNHVYAGDTTPVGTSGHGVRYAGICIRNTVYGFATPYADCRIFTGAGYNWP